MLRWVLFRLPEMIESLGVNGKVRNYQKSDHKLDKYFLFKIYTYILYVHI